MKKQLKIVVLILSFICVLNFSGCTLFTQPGGHFFSGMGLINLPFNLPHFGIFDPNEELPEKMDLDKLIISSKAEVDELFSETYYGPYLEEEPGLIRDDKFTNLINSFNDEFFENNQIVCFFISAPNTSYSYKLLNTNYNNGVLTITIKKSSTGSGLDVIVDLFVIIEIEKVPTDTVVKIVYKDNWLQNLFW